MKTVIHHAAERGHAHHGWLDTWHTFSFARWFDPDRINFGVLRVLNDDTVAGGEGFGTHPHDNMEIVSIPLEGELRHGDSMGHDAVLRPGQIQVMSAGTGLTHSEFNASVDRLLKFLQIWVFPRRQGEKPRYGDFTLPPVRPNELRTIVTPDTAQESGVAWIRQDAWFHTLDLSRSSFEYAIRRPDNGLYVFVIEGSAEVAGKPLERRDGIGVWAADRIEISTPAAAKLLLIDLPM